MPSIANVRFAVLVLAITALLSGCQDPLSVDSTHQLRREVLEAYRRHTDPARGAPEVELSRPPSDLYLEQDPQRLRELDEASGPQSYASMPLGAGTELDLITALNNAPTRTASLSIQQAIQLAVQNNLELQIAQLQPAVSEAEIVAAAAAFDAVFFTDASFTKSDRPQTRPVISTDLGSVPVGTPARVNDLANLSTGIRKRLDTGGVITVSTTFDYSNNQSPGLNVSPDKSWTAALLLGVSQPLLRNFGSDVNRAQIAVARNAHRRDVLNLHAQLLVTTAEVEAAYWSLVFARNQLAIRQQLLKDSIETRDKLTRREEFDVDPLQKAQANQFTEARRLEVLQASRTLRAASDQLKRLINSPDLPLTDEVLVLPLDQPLELPLAYSLPDAVTTALQKRPEVRAALLDIDDASIRQRVADNQRLPLLNLNAQVQYFGLEGRFDGAAGGLADADFIEYLIGLQFETPIGNRAAEAIYRQSRVGRQQSVVQYKNVAQQVIQSVVASLRDLRTNWVAIDIARRARRAAAEDLRALIVREERGGQALDANFLLDRKLRSQATRADLQLAELQATIDYNIAIARLRQVTGTLLEHNRIQFAWPSDMFDEAP